MTGEGLEKAEASRLNKQAAKKLHLGSASWSATQPGAGAQCEPPNSRSVLECVQLAAALVGSGHSTAAASCTHSKRWRAVRHRHSHRCGHLCGGSGAARFWSTGTPGKIPSANPVGPLSNHRSLITDYRSPLASPPLTA